MRACVHGPFYSCHPSDMPWLGLLDWVCSGSGLSLSGQAVDLDGFWHWGCAAVPTCGCGGSTGGPLLSRLWGGVMGQLAFKSLPLCGDCGSVCLSMFVVVNWGLAGICPLSHSLTHTFHIKTYTQADSWTHFGCYIIHVLFGLLCNYFLLFLVVFG